MNLQDSIESLNYLFEKLIINGQLVNLTLENKTFIQQCKIKSVRSIHDYSYEILADNKTYLTLNPEQIQLIRYDVISDSASSFESFRSSLSKAEIHTKSYDFMIHFMIHDFDRASGFLLTVKVLKSQAQNHIPLFKI
ncbi:hypothetical protein EJP82_26665 [Paenibacillus anaericanus]|uniref:Uncharacterized protein n=1 Tax=Paenibacillus anaericanus TaxID=170367 RepID=A0A3S1E611_9BACL|nr:hypothetical protein [Paenibacillus anaericanus]RUT38699.1 hypothetical protein EJP82_26665 [Paenibacillus anaericanus]